MLWNIWNAATKNEFKTEFQFCFPPPPSYKLRFIYAHGNIFNSIILFSTKNRVSRHKPKIFVAKSSNIKKGMKSNLTRNRFSSTTVSFSNRNSPLSSCDECRSFGHHISRPTTFHRPVVYITRMILRLSFSSLLLFPTP